MEFCKDDEKSQHVYMLRKSRYIEVLKMKREALVLQLFSKDISILSNKMKESADKMENCNETYTFPVPELYDLPKLEKILQDYFRDCGYTVTSQVEEKENKKTIKMNLS